MDDCISREAVINICYERQGKARSKTELESISRIWKAVKKLPSAPVREVVMCGECVNWDTSWQNDYEPNCHYCPMIDNKCNGDFYCGYAERRTDADTKI